MNNSNNEDVEADREKPKFAIWLLIFMGLIALLAFTRLAGLVFGPSPGISSNLVSTYLSYAFLTIFMMHFIVFYFRQLAPHLFTTRTPRYFEYIYTLVIGFGLLQIVVAGPKLASYIHFRYGDTQTQLLNIQESAVSEWNYYCKDQNYTKYWSLEYCLSVLEIANNPDRSSTFYNAATEAIASHGTKYGTTGGARSLGESEVARRILILKDYETLTNNPIENGSSDILTWYALMLLPIGIGLRLVKTSLELF